MDSRDYLSQRASTTYDDDADVVEEYPSLIVLCLRVLTILFGLFVLLPVVVLSPIVLLISAVVSRAKDQPVTETLDRQSSACNRHPRVIPASIEELAAELIAG